MFLWSSTAPHVAPDSASEGEDEYHDASEFGEDDESLESFPSLSSKHSLESFDTFPPFSPLTPSPSSLLKTPGRRISWRSTRPSSSSSATEDVKAAKDSNSNTTGNDSASATSGLFRSMPTLFPTSASPNGLFKSTVLSPITPPQNEEERNAQSPQGEQQEGEVREQEEEQEIREQDPTTPVKSNNSASPVRPTYHRGHWTLTSKRDNAVDDEKKEEVGVAVEQIEETVDHIKQPAIENAESSADTPSMLDLSFELHSALDSLGRNLKELREIDASNDDGYDDVLHVLKADNETSADQSTSDDPLFVVEEQSIPADDDCQCWCPDGLLALLRGGSKSNSNALVTTTAYLPQSQAVSTMFEDNMQQSVESLRSDLRVMVERHAHKLTLSDKELILSEISVIEKSLDKISSLSISDLADIGSGNQC